jgi:HSP20 family protein
LYAKSIQFNGGKTKMKDISISNLPIFKTIGAAEQLWKDSFGSYPFERLLPDEKFFNNLFDGLPTKSFPVNISETETEVKLEAEMPGVKKEDISIDLKDRLLTLKAEKKQNITEESDKYILRQETCYGFMQRSFNVGDVDPNNIKATFNDGVLKITLQKVGACGFKKIEIQ